MLASNLTIPAPGGTYLAAASFVASSVAGAQVALQVMSPLILHGGSESRVQWGGAGLAAASVVRISGGWWQAHPADVATAAKPWRY